MSISMNHKTLPWLGVLTLGALGVSFAPPAARESLSLTLIPNKAVYAPGEEIRFLVQGLPNTFTVLGADPDPGPTSFPFGTVNLGFSPQLIRFEGVSNADGIFDIYCIQDCDDALFGVTVYLQAVQLPNGATPILSNPASVLWDDLNGECGGVNLCPGGGRKPQSITMIYTGDDCSATNNSQAAGKVICSGDPGFAPLVRILSHDPPSKYVWFEGDVALGGTFVIDALNAGRTQLQGDTIVEIFDVNTGAQLQFVQFHTSCSQPLISGDQYGGVQLQSLVLAP